MPTPYTPQLQHHKASGLAVVRIGGKDHYCGRWGTPAALAKYHRFIAEYLATGDPDATCDPTATIMDITAAWLQHVESYYRKNGEPTSEASAQRTPARYLLRLYADLPVAEFGPRCCLAVRHSMIAAGLARKSINRHIGRIKQMFAWAAENELIDPALHHRLLCVKGLMPGRGGRETLPRRSAGVSDFLAVAAAAPPVVAAMLHLQYHTGMRPGECRIIRPGDIDRSGDVWLYRPGSFKSEHHPSRWRVIALGHNAQMILTPWLQIRPDRYCFLSAAGRIYTKDGYARVVRRAARRAGVAVTAHQLRHTFATRTQKVFGMEAARAALGHAHLATTDIYIDRDTAAAVAVAAKIG